MQQHPPAHEDIEALAYELWLQNGRPDGAAEQNWLEAERELQTATISHRLTDIAHENGGSVQP